MNKEKGKEFERILKALANQRRLAILTFLKRQKKGASVGEVASEIKLSFRATSRHLLVLSHAEILEREQQGLRIFYKIAYPLDTLSRSIISLL